ncbi:hypothetical protein E3N88_04559 [Mikania micrantha]|uniref:Uncharacterized protein n=1 Tax=Mikania micrantha TaxID=192012 RepID=A0A5N6PWV2_9ASTR|nr:hypothetical protein E3N88_04559 [Mikania micrantha]
MGDETVTFEVVKSMRHPSDQDDFSDPCHSVYFINSFMSHVDRFLEYVCRADLVVERCEEEVQMVEESVSVISEVLEIAEFREESMETPETLWKFDIVASREAHRLLYCATRGIPAKTRVNIPSRNARTSSPRVAIRDSPRRLKMLLKP